MNNTKYDPLLVEQLILAVDALFRSSIGKATLYEPEGGALWQAWENIKINSMALERPEIERSPYNPYDYSHEGDPWP